MPLTADPSEADCEAAVRPALDRLRRNGAQVDCERGFLGPEEAARLLRRLQRELEWDSEKASSVRRPYARDRIPIPRQQTAYGDPGTSYAFSGTVVYARPWIDALLELRDRLRERTGFDSNFVLINHYRNGDDYLGWHSDDERDMGEEPELYSLSLGATRDFQLRPRGAHGEPRRKGDIVTLPLEAGTLLYMGHPTNRDWKHQLPRRGGKRAGAIGPRLSLTWRRMASGRD